MTNKTTKVNKIKLSQLELESNLKEDSLIPIVQDNHTKAIKSKDLLKAVNDKYNTLDKKVENLIANPPQSGGNSVIIDDNNISLDKVWSSNKIEDFVLTNVGAIWQEINGGQMAIDSTMDGFLREVEILGNTIQNQDDLSDIQHLGVWNEEKQGYEIEICVSNSSSKDNLNYQDFRTSIVLPCQLMKVGKVSDRLYWDKDKGRYVIDKIIKSTNLPAIENVINSTITDKGGYCGVDYWNSKEIEQWKKAFDGIPSLETEQMQHGFYMLIQDVKSITSYSNTWFDNGQKGKFLSIQDNGNWIRLIFRDSNCTDAEQMNNWIISLSGNEAYYRLTDPQIIDTGIKEQIKLPTFINNTYITVNGGIQGSIKAKAPIDGGKIIAVLERKNKELEEINKEQDELINTTILATNEMYVMLEPLLTNMLIDGEAVNPLVNMYVAMIKRGLLKTIDQIPEKYRDLVNKNIEIL